MIYLTRKMDENIELVKRFDSFREDLRKYTNAGQWQAVVSTQSTGTHNTTNANDTPFNLPPSLSLKITLPLSFTFLSFTCTSSLVCISSSHSLYHLVALVCRTLQPFAFNLVFPSSLL
eukprot:TRINITY_DN12101_c0_g1_i1.p2 TRINITY_DN12101_c0_g1~~TRINITY_DN12101_c0_g1_i1.p2  ORF type:complete len:118 (+),score=21.64 TRINITY_DN12101_c0_g1_i1:320-673(+)